MGGKTLDQFQSRQQARKTKETEVTKTSSADKGGEKK